MKKHMLFCLVALIVMVGLLCVGCGKTQEETVETMPSDTVAVTQTPQETTNSTEATVELETEGTVATHETQVNEETTPQETTAATDAETTPATEAPTQPTRPYIGNDIWDMEEEPA